MHQLYNTDKRSQSSRVKRDLRDERFPIDEPYSYMAFVAALCRLLLYICIYRALLSIVKSHAYREAFSEHGCVYL